MPIRPHIVPRCFFPWALAVIAVTCLGLAPRQIIESQESLVMPFGDKAQHFIVYSVLSVSGMAAFRRGIHGLAAAASMLLHGVLLECLQTTMNNGREFEGSDIAFDALGVICGIAARLAARRARL
jgi:VanZ family protein